MSYHGLSDFQFPNLKGQVLRLRLQQLTGIFLGKVVAEVYGLKNFFLNFLFVMIQFLWLRDFSFYSFLTPPTVFPYIVTIVQFLNNSHKSIILLFKCILPL